MYIWVYVPVPGTLYQVPGTMDSQGVLGMGDVSQLRYILGVPIKVYFQSAKIYLGKIYLTGCQS